MKETVTTQALLSLLEFSAPYLTRLERMGVVARADRNSWDLADTIRRIIRYLREDNRRGRRAEAATELARLKARALELRLARENHELIPLAESMATVDSIVGGLVSALSAVPARRTRDLALRRTIEAEINLVRTIAAAECRRQAEALMTTGKAKVSR